MSRDSKTGAPPGPEGGFLSRWARLKRESEATAVQPGPLPQPLQPAPDPEMQALESQREQAIASKAKRELDDLIAQLPRIDTITATTDVTGFMNALIPDALRNAALRAAWSADPGIRDFLNDARDYALDYNTPGAAYGYGPLTESDLAGLKDMVHGIFGDKPEPEQTKVEDDTLVIKTTETTSEISDMVSQSTHVASQKLQEAASIPQSVRLGSKSDHSHEMAESQGKLPREQRLDHAMASSVSDGAVRHEHHDAATTHSDVMPNRRRGGSAMPV